MENTYTLTKKLPTYHLIDLLYVNLVKLLFVPNIHRIRMFVNPLVNQISAILSVPCFVGILGVGLIVGNKFSPAAREDDIYSITIRVVYEL